MFVEYTAKSPVADYDLSSFALGETRLDAYVLSLVGETGFGSPTDYEAGKIVVDNRQKNTATLTYRNDAEELTLKITVNVDDSYIISVDILRETTEEPELSEIP